MLELPKTGSGGNRVANATTETTLGGACGSGGGGDPPLSARLYIVGRAWRRPGYILRTMVSDETGAGHLHPTQNSHFQGGNTALL